jgi:tetratricopeptide (TPR) repeat protein
MRSGLKLLTQAVELARNLGNPDTLWTVCAFLLLYRQAPQHTQDRVRLAEELIVSSRVGLNTATLGWTLLQIGNAFLALGQRQHAEEVWGELRANAERTGQINLWLISACCDAVLALMDGRLEDVTDMARRIRSRGEEAGVSQIANSYAGQADGRAWVYLATGLEALERRIRLLGSQLEYLLCLVLSHLGRKEEASEILERYVVRRPWIGTAEDETPTYWDTLLLEAAIMAGYRRAAELLLNRFAGTGVYTPGIFYPTVIPRHLGGAATLLGRYEEARKHYDEAIKVCTEMRFRPELALTRLQLAELLLEHYPDEKKEALEYLDFAIKEFREMKMQPSLERALRHKEILKA